MKKFEINLCNDIQMNLIGRREKINRNSLEKLFPSKEIIKQAYSRKLQYDMWDKKSPIYVYNIFESTIRKMLNKGQIKEMFLYPIFTSPCVAFSDKKSAEIYKQVQDTIDNKIQERVKESFKIGYSNLAEVKTIRTDIKQ